MLYSPLIDRALRLCYEAHHGQLDKSGVPYVFHPFHLAEQMETEETVLAALLHDVLEDSSLTPDALREAGFPEAVVTAVVRLTHDRAVPYLDYVRALRDDPIARAVKLADLRHNSDLSRLERVTDRDRARVRKYRAALRLLSGEEDEAGPAPPPCGAWREEKRQELP